MRIAVEGCAHGELEKIYSAIQEAEKRDGMKVDLLLCCGDFQSTRNLADLKCMACPDKFKDMCSFYKYYSATSEKVAPVLTIFIGGNHEASNYLQELPYGGWVAPNIYYLGYAGVVNVKGVRIGGLSGIYKGHDYMKGRFEKPPYDKSTQRSVYHIRNLDVFRLKQLKNNPPEIFMTHDWPRGIHKHGDINSLLKRKPFFREDIDRNALGSRPAEELLDCLQPPYWFSAHLHVKFPALVQHKNVKNSDDHATRFLALDKCLPKRKFLQILEIGPHVEGPIELSYDKEWLSILKSTNHLVSSDMAQHYMPGQGTQSRWDFTPTQTEINEISTLFEDNLLIPHNFEITASPYDPRVENVRQLSRVVMPQAVSNEQTEIFCHKMKIDDPMKMLIDGRKVNHNDSSNIMSISSLLGASKSDEVDSNVEADGDDSIRIINKDEITLEDDSDSMHSTNSQQTHSQPELPGQNTTDLSSTFPKKMRLQLPDPKCDDETGLDLDERLPSPILGISKLKAPFDASPQNDGESLSVDVHPDSVLNSEAGSKKQLKRRNVAIYVDNEAE